MGVGNPEEQLYSIQPAFIALSFRPGLKRAFSIPANDALIAMLRRRDFLGRF